MKIWILRLSGKVIAQYSRTRPVDENTEQSKEEKKEQSWLSAWLSSWFQSAPAVNPEQQQKQILEHTTRCILLQLIDHSRKLPLQQYTHELNYTRIRGQNYYYLARHKLLFVYREEDDNLSILGIENILTKTVRLYQDKSMSIFKKNKLPNHLNEYQLRELKDIGNKINEIIEEEDDFQFVRKESIRDSGALQGEYESEMERRRQKFDEILNWHHQNERKNVKLAYQIQKKVNKYRIKLCLLCLLATIVATVGFYLIATSDFSTQL